MGPGFLTPPSAADEAVLTAVDLGLGLFLVVIAEGLHHAPRGVRGARFGTALGARLGVLLRFEEGVEIVAHLLERTRFLEAPMTTLLHGSTPGERR